MFYSSIGIIFPDSVPTTGKYKGLRCCRVIAGNGVIMFGLTVWG